ncbi:MAG: hypothetical protein IKZ01_04945 [Anaerotignum sp.]|nr:hypothetical protein [Anaerotignum sp.]
MTEREKRYRRREMERRMRMRETANRRGKEKKSGLTAFRTYVTSVLVGGCLLISAFQTETSNMVCTRVKEVIAMQFSAEVLGEWKTKVRAYFDGLDISVPVFEMKENEGEKKVYHPDTEP